jgi:hypothetical protein
MKAILSLNASRDAVRAGTLAGPHHPAKKDKALAALTNCL